MKIFLDSANLREIEEAVDKYFVDGVTTNPTLVAREIKTKNKGKIHEYYRQILSKVDGPVSLEVISDEFDGMIKEAKELRSLGGNVVVKLPATSDGIEVLHEVRDGIKTNLTLCFTVHQALLAARQGATYISPFMGRLDDYSRQKGKEGIEQGFMVRGSVGGADVVRNIKNLYRKYGFQTQVLAASIRSLEHVEQAMAVGADIVTVPFKLLKEMYQHPLTDKGLKQFIKDWKNE